MATYSYKVYKKQYSYDGGQTWYDVDPPETIKMVTGWDVECSGLTYAAKISKVFNNCDLDDGYYEWLISENGSGVTRNDVIKTWGNGGSGRIIVSHHNLGAPTFIGNECDSGSSISHKLHIMPTCEEIGDYAFDSGTQKVPNTYTIEVGINNLNEIIFEGNTTLKSIGRNAFYWTNIGNLDAIDTCVLGKTGGKLEIPDTVETIGMDAFSETWFLDYVKIGSGVTNIGSGAFTSGFYPYHAKLTEFTSLTPPICQGNDFIDTSGNGSYPTFLVPSGSVSAYKNSLFSEEGRYNYHDEYLGLVTSKEPTTHSFEWNLGYTDNITAVTSGNVTSSRATWAKFGSGVTEIADNVFSGKTWLDYVQFSEGLKKIGNNAFNNTPSLHFINLPNSLEEIGEMAFYHSNPSVYTGYIYQLTLGTSLKKIGRYAFEFRYIKCPLVIPDSVEEIGDGAFYGCNIKQLNWGNNPSIKKIGSHAFYNCFTVDSPYNYCGLQEEFVIPDSVEEVGTEFLGVTGTSSTIKRVIVGSGVTKMGDILGPGNYIFKSLTPPQITSMSMGNGTNVYVPCSSLMLYKSTSPFSIYPEHVYPIEDDCGTTRWERFGYKDVDGQLYANEIEQTSFDSGATWYNTGSERQTGSSLGSSSYNTVASVLRYNTASGITNTIPSLGVTFKTNTEIYVNVSFTYLDWRGGTNGYLIGDGSSVAIIPRTTGSASQWGYLYNIGSRTLTAGNVTYPGETRFKNYMIYYTQSGSLSPNKYWTGTTSLGTIEASANLGLFNGNVAGNVLSIKIYEGSTLVRDFEPRYLTSLNTATLYDKVSNTYCEVNGTLSYTN